MLPSHFLLCKGLDWSDSECSQFATLARLGRLFMIAFITFNSSWVPLIEGLCTSTPWEWTEDLLTCAYTPGQDGADVNWDVINVKCCGTREGLCLARAPAIAFRLCVALLRSSAVACSLSLIAHFESKWHWQSKQKHKKTQNTTILTQEPHHNSNVHTQNMYRRECFVFCRHGSFFQFQASASYCCYSCYKSTKQ